MPYSRENGMHLAKRWARSTTDAVDIADERAPKTPRQPADAIGRNASKPHIESYVDYRTHPKKPTAGGQL
jgi:hypothetical protein